MTLDYPKWVFDLGPPTRLEFLGLVDQGIGFVIFVEGFALAKSHDHMPGDIGFGVWTLFNSLVSRIAKGHCLLSAQH